MFENIRIIEKQEDTFAVFIFLAVEVVKDGSKNEEFKIIFKQVKKFGIP